jgi:hypothetical protein
VHLELDLGDGLVEGLALDRTDLELESRWLPRTVASSEGARTPWATCRLVSKGLLWPLIAHTTMNLRQVGKLREGLRVSEGNEDNSVVGQRAQGVGDSGLLSSSGGSGGDEDTGVFAGEGTTGPEATGGIPEGLPLTGEVTVTGGDTEEEGIEFLQVVNTDDGVIRLGWRMQDGEEVWGESLRDPEWDS